MKKIRNKPAKKSAVRKAKTREAVEVIFRERKFGDILGKFKHPKPIPGYKATLPGPPGWQAKERPGA